MADILVWARFRTHLLLPHDIVGAIGGTRPIFSGLEIQSTGAVDLYLRHDKPVLRVEREQYDHRKQVKVTALTDIWLQEPGLTVITSAGMWRGFGRNGAWTSRWYDLKGVPDAHRATVHFPRDPNHSGYTMGVEYRGGDARWRLRSDGGFAKLLNVPPATVPWEGCDVFGRGWTVKGTVPDTSGRSRLRWELAAAPATAEGDAWMHFLGWPGGAGAVVQGVRPYRADQILYPDVPIDHLWDPRGWRRLGRNQHIEQTLSMRRFANETGGGQRAETAHG